LWILLCHSVLGLRDVEHEAADLLAHQGHVVSVPDLFGGAIATSIDEGAEIVARIGWPTVCAIAEEALKGLPIETVLAGFSMCVGVASELWSRRPRSAGAVFLHALPTIPSNIRPAFPFQVHVGANDDMFADAASLKDLNDRGRELSVAAEVYRYPGAGHFFTDTTLPEFNQNAARLTWERVIDYLARLDADHGSQQK
jgi:dienelactone hydrolase